MDRLKAAVALPDPKVRRRAVELGSGATRWCSLQVPYGLKVSASLRGPSGRTICFSEKPCRAAGLSVAQSQGESHCLQDATLIQQASME